MNAERDINIQQIQTDGGTHIDGDVNTGGGCFIGRDLIVNLFDIKAVSNLITRTLKFLQHSWQFWVVLLIVEGVLLSLFLRYQKRFLLSQTIFLIGAILAGVTVWCWSQVIVSRSESIKFYRMLGIASILSLLSTGTIGQQVWTVLKPPQFSQETFGIAIATFGEGPDFQITRRGLQISNLIYQNLQQTITGTVEIRNSVSVKPIGVIQDTNQGRVDGERINADLVIWGQLLEQNEGGVINFQILQTPGMLDNPAFPQVLPVAHHYVQSSIDIKSSDSLTVKQITERQSLAISAFSLGLYYQAKPDYQLASQQLELAKNYLLNVQDSTSVTDIGLVLLYLGRCYLQLSQYEKALEVFNQAVSYRPDDSAIYLSQAYIYGVIRQQEQRRAALQQVLDLGQQHQGTASEIPALYNRAIAYEALDDVDAALREYEAILELDPKFFSAYLSKGRVLIRLKRYDDAVQAHNQAQSLVADDPARQIWLNLDAGRLAELRNKPDTAIQDYEAARNLNPTLTTPYFYLAELHNRLGNLDAALLNYRELPEVSYDKGWAHAVYAEFLFKIGDYVTAIEQYNKALRYRIYDKSLPYTYLGQAYAKNGQLNLAQNAFENALRSPGLNAYYIHTSYGNVLAQFEQFDAAIVQYEAAIANSSELAFDAKFNLARAYQSLGSSEKAKSIYNSLLKHKDQLTNTQYKMVEEQLDHLGQ